MNNNDSKGISNTFQNNPFNNDRLEKDNEALNIPNSLPSNYQYVTKGRKTLYNSSHINLESPKKENPSRSKRLSLLNKGNVNNNISNKNIELFSFGKEIFGSNKKLRKRKNKESKNLNLNYKLLIKRIAAQLKKRIKLPTCKILKIYQPYRELILRIARGIKKTSKKYNNKEINTNEERNKNQMTLLLKEENKKSKKKEMLLQPKEKQEYEDNINYLLSIDDSNQNNNFINEFEKFLEVNNIQISDYKVPSFKNEKNNYLLSNLFFWIKFIKYICQKYKNNLSFFNFMNFIEVFYTWIDYEKFDCSSFQKLIIDQMELAFDKDKINNFLLMHKLKNIDDIFIRYKNMNNYYQEAQKQKNCQCPNCQNIQQKVINYNKKHIYISYSEENNLDYKNKIIKFPESKTIFDDKDLGLSIDGLSFYSNNEIKDNKITQFFRCSKELKPIKQFSPNIITIYNDKKKITDYFAYKKIKRVDKKEKEEKEDKKSSNKKQNKSSDNKINNKKYNKRNKGKKEKMDSKKTSEHILKLLNIQP